MSWVEVWIDSGSGDYVLVVRPAKLGGVEIVNPQENGRVEAAFLEYEGAVHWLNEEEYDLVEGRWSQP